MHRVKSQHVNHFHQVSHSLRSSKVHKADVVHSANTPTHGAGNANASLARAPKIDAE